MILVLCGLFFITKTTSAQGAKSTANSKSYYKIQLGAYKNPEMTRFSNLNEAGALYTEDAGNGITRVLVGEYFSKIQAQKILNEVHKLGYADAFIAIKVKTAEIQTNNTPAKIPTNAVVSKPKKTSIVQHSSSDAYIIQLGVYEVIQFDSFKPINYLGEFFVEKEADLTKVMLGVYYSKTAAENALKKIQKLEGYGNAFIRKAPDTWL